MAVVPVPATGVDVQAVAPEAPLRAALGARRRVDRQAGHRPPPREHPQADRRPAARGAQGRVPTAAPVALVRKVRLLVAREHGAPGVPSTPGPVVAPGGHVLTVPSAPFPVARRSSVPPARRSCVLGVPTRQVSGDPTAAVRAAPTLRVRGARRVRGPIAGGEPTRPNSPTRRGQAEAPAHAVRRRGHVVVRRWRAVAASGTGPGLPQAAVPPGRPALGRPRMHVDPQGLPGVSVRPRGSVLATMPASPGSNGRAGMTRRCCRQRWCRAISTALRAVACGRCRRRTPTRSLVTWSWPVG